MNDCHNADGILRA